MKEIRFRSAGEGRLAKAEVRNLKRSSVEGKAVFLNVAKTLEELKPSRMAFKVCNGLKKLEAAWLVGQRKHVTIDRFRDSVLVVDGDRAGFANTNCQWLWTPASMSRYGQSALALAKAWIDMC